MFAVVCDLLDSTSQHWHCRQLPLQMAWNAYESETTKKRSKHKLQYITSYL